VRIWFNDPDRQQSRGEELANSISHGVGLLLALVGAPVLIVDAAHHHTAAFIVGASIFSATFIILYLASVLYHAWPQGQTKSVLQVIEHSAIFLLIAGTYTPISLGVLRGTIGWILFGTVWGLAASGIVLKGFIRDEHPVLTTILYLLMGWLVVFAVDPLFARMPAAGIRWLVAGGLAYTCGVVFFALDARVKFAHTVWHLFVIAGTFCHYLVVLRYGA